MNIKGKIVELKDTQQVTDTFKKREVVVQTTGDYPQYITIEFIQEKCDLLNTYKVDDVVEVGLNLNGRKWETAEGETKYFNSVQGWKIFNDNAEPVKVQKVAQGTDGDDLPF
jgi:hypothetical protein